MSFEQQHKLLLACMDGKATLDLNGYVYTDDNIYKVINSFESLSLITLTHIPKELYYYTQ